MDLQTASNLTYLRERTISDEAFRAQIREELKELSDNDLIRHYLGSELRSCAHCGSGVYFLLKGGHDSRCPLAHPESFPDHDPAECGLCRGAARIERQKKMVKSLIGELYFERKLDQRANDDPDFPG